MVTPLDGGAGIIPHFLWPWLQAVLVEACY